MRQDFKLIGLNAPWTTGGFPGYYATIQTGSDDSDWFHSGFDENYISIERQKALFAMFKNSSDSLWSGKNHIVTVEFDRWSPGGNPVKPIIVDLKLDDL